MLFESLKRLTEKKQPLTLDEKKWLVETINTKINLIGKEKLYALLVVHNKQDRHSPPNSSLPRRSGSECSDGRSPSEFATNQYPLSLPDPEGIWYDPTDPFYDIEKLSVGLQLVWFEFTKMHLKSQNEIDFSNTSNK